MKRLSLAVLLGFVLLELVVRFLLFTDNETLARFAKPLRDPALYTTGTGSRDYWRLLALLDSEESIVHPQFDPLLGWARRTIREGDYRNRGEGKLAGRRPILFYGDSFTACTSGLDFCWSALLRNSEWNDRYHLINYGVGGFGVDQTFLLMRESLKAYAELDPLVIVGVLVDDDLDRSYLPQRPYPKPLFTLDGDELELIGVREETPRACAERSGWTAWSYVGRYLLFKSGLFPARLRDFMSGRVEHNAAKQALNRRLLLEIQTELEGHGLDYLFVIFHGRQGLTSEGPYGWQEPLLLSVFKELDIPFVSSKKAILEDAAATGTTLSDYFLEEGRLIWHYPAGTNEVVFPAILEGILRSDSRATD